MRLVAPASFVFGFHATGRQQIQFSTQAGQWDHPESATMKTGS